MFRKVTCYLHIDFYDLVGEVEKTEYNGDFETDFIEHYQPSPTCAIKVSIPSENDLNKYDWDEWKRIMFLVLKKNGFNSGVSVYVDIDY